MGSVKRYFFIAVPLLFIALFRTAGHSAEGLQWERFRMAPALSLSESYSDNVYLTGSDVRGDASTAVSPNVSLDLAIAPKNILSARYHGVFRHYERSDNFKEYIYQTGLSWTVTAPKGSTLKIDAGEDHNANQPYSAADTYKEYVERAAFAEASLKALGRVELGLRYDHANRRYADALYSFDDFTRDSATVNATYWALPVTGFLLEYSFSRQKNQDLVVSPVMDTQIVLAGMAWRPTEKLSGHLKAGYYSSRLDGGTSSSGFDADTDLAYKVSAFTRISLAAYRRLVRTTIVNRETGAFYISTGGRVSASYSRWKPVTMTVDAVYGENTFNQLASLPAGERRDTYSGAGLGVRHAPRDWLAIMVNYHYRANDSDSAGYGYRENRVEARLLLAI